MTQINAAARLVADVTTAAEKLFLWRHNPTTGIWNQMRDVTPETQDQWLKIFKEDDPHADFKISARQPKASSSKHGERLGK